MTEATSELLNYKAVGAVAVLAILALAFVCRLLLKEMKGRLEDQKTWAGEQREDWEKTQGLLQELGAVISDCSATSEAARKAAVGAIKRIEALAAATPNLDQVVWQAGKGAAVS